MLCCTLFNTRSGVNTVAVALCLCRCNRQHLARFLLPLTRRDGSCDDDRFAACLSIVPEIAAFSQLLTILFTRSNTARWANRCLLAWETPRRVDTSAVEASGVNTVAVALPSCLCNRQHSARLEATTTTTRRDGSCGEDPVRCEPEYRAGEPWPYACANKAGWRCPCRPRRQRDARARLDPYTPPPQSALR